MSKIQQFELPSFHTGWHQNRNTVSLKIKKVSSLYFQQYNHFKYWKICLCARMLVLEWEQGAFTEKVNSRCFCWFPAAILVHQNGTPIWCLHTKLYKGMWNDSETVGHKDLRHGKIVYVQVFYNIHFLGFFHWTVSNLFFCWTVKTIYILSLFIVFAQAFLGIFNDKTWPVLGTNKNQVL